MTDVDFAYSNLSDRRPGRVITTAARLMPGIARVQSDVIPFAEAWRRANLQALAETGPLWVALGDSLTQGIGAPAYDRGWVGQVRERLAAAGRSYRVVNLAVSGATTADVLERQLPALESLGSPPDLVTLMIGSNDLMRAANRVTMPERFERILRRLPANSVVTSMPNPSRVARRANDVLARVAAERGLTIAELRDSRTMSWRGKLADDHFHPNERGYAGLASVIADTLLARTGPDSGSPS